MEYYIPNGKVVSTKTRPWFNHECSHAVTQDQAPYQAWARASAYGDPAVDRLKAAYNKAATAAEIFYDDGSLHSHLWLREYIQKSDVLVELRSLDIRKASIPVIPAFNT